MSGRKHDCVWLYLDKSKVVGKYKKCDKDKHGFVAKIKKNYLNLKNLI